MSLASGVSAITPVELRLSNPPVVPGEIEEMIVEAESRRGVFLADTASRPIPGFVGSNLRVAYGALCYIVDRGLSPGLRFCEWGSGMGFVTCLAARLGLEATGIEIEPRLIAAARCFAAEFAPSARFVEGSYQPDGLFTEAVDKGRLGEKLGFSPTAFDLIYVFPWPAEERPAMRLFERFGRNRGLLLSFHGGASLRLHRRLED